MSANLFLVAISGQYDPPHAKFHRFPSIAPHVSFYRSTFEIRPFRSVELRGVAERASSTSASCWLRAGLRLPIHRGGISYRVVSPDGICFCGRVEFPRYYVDARRSSWEITCVTRKSVRNSCTAVVCFNSFLTLRWDVFLINPPIYGRMPRPPDRSKENI